VDISSWGSTSRFNFNCGSTVDSLRAATVEVIRDSTCSADYGGNKKVRERLRSHSAG
jgi:hypothetical protein